MDLEVSYIDGTVTQKEMRLGLRKKDVNQEIQRLDVNITVNL